MFDGSPDGVEVVGRGAGGDQHQVGKLHHGADQAGNLGRGIDDGEAEAAGAGLFDALGQIGKGGGEEHRSFRLAPVPPGGEATLGIGVEQHDGSVAGPFRLDGEVTAEGCFPRPAFL